MIPHGLDAEMARMKRQQKALKLRKWCRLNPEKVRAYRARYRERDLPKARERLRRWRERNREKRRSSQRKWYAENRTKEVQRSLRYRAKNIVRYRIHANNYIKARYASDLSFRIGVILRSRLHKAVNRPSKKCASAIQLIGCSIEELKKELSDDFSQGMSWENYGKKWEIDHKIACAKFDLTTEEGQRACFHFSNLQPLTIHDNRSKGMK